MLNWSGDFFFSWHDCVFGWVKHALRRISCKSTSDYLTVPTHSSASCSSFKTRKFCSVYIRRSSNSQFSSLPCKSMQYLQQVNWMNEKWMRTRECNGLKDHSPTPHPSPLRLLTPAECPFDCWPSAALELHSHPLLWEPPWSGYVLETPAWQGKKYIK